jgi:recombination protein RecT
MATQQKEIQKSRSDIVRENLNPWVSELGNFVKGENEQDEFIQSAVIAITESDDLQACLNNKEGQISLFNALRRAAKTGLSLNPQDQHAHLQVYKGKVTLITMKEGLIDMAIKSGVVKSVYSKTVRENDVFELSESETGSQYKFSPARKSRGEIEGFFCVLTFPSGNPYVEYMTKEEVDEVKKKVKGSDNEWSGWTRYYEGFGKKTVVRRGLKTYSEGSGEGRAEIRELMSYEEDYPEPEKDITPTTQSQEVADKLKSKAEPESKKGTTQKVPL